MIAIFKTNVDKTRVAKNMVNKLLKIFPGAEVNFDLKDCDRILRIKNHAPDFEIAKVIELVEQEGHSCEEMND
jgi:hypothetical protein